MTTARSLRTPALVLLAWLLLAPAHAAETLKLVTGDYAPFTGAQLPSGGPLTEIARRAFAASGLEVKVSFLPWKRGYAETLSGQYDASFPYGRSPEREQSFYFSESFYTVDRRMYYPADVAARPQDPQWLKGKRYCLPLGFALFKELGQMVERKELEVQSPPNLESCVKMLTLQRVDFFITTPDIAKAAVAQAGTSLPLASQSVGKSENYLIVPKTHPQGPAIIAAFNKGVAVLRSKGTLDTLMQAPGR